MKSSGSVRNTIAPSVKVGTAAVLILSLRQKQRRKYDNAGKRQKRKQKKESITYTVNALSGGWTSVYTNVP